MALRTSTTLPTTRMTVGPEWDPNTKLGNWDKYRTPITEIVIHTMVGTVAGADARFNDPHSNVSAHYGIGYDGKKYQWVDEDYVAYHAGYYPANQCSIGIEHEDLGNYNDSRPDVLYASSAELVAELCKFYNIPCDATHVIPHHNVPNVATACPDNLDVNRIISQAQAIINTPIPTPVEQLPKDSVLRDMYTFLCGSYSDAEITWRLQSGKNLVEIGTDICSGDNRFKTKWITPNIPSTPSTPSTPEQPSTPPTEPPTPPVDPTPTPPTTSPPPVHNWLGDLLRWLHLA